MVAAVIFDNDGLTLDTESAWTRAETALFDRHGATFTLEHKRELLGSSRGATKLMLERQLGLPGRGAALMAELHELAMAELGREVPPMPGAVELLRALRERGVPVGLASNSTIEFVDLALASAGLREAFDVVVTADRVARPKPAPDVYLTAAEGLGAAPERCVALEDSHTGVAAAQAAGMVVIGIPSLPGIELEGADLVAASLADAAVWERLGLSTDGGP